MKSILFMVFILASCTSTPKRIKEATFERYILYKGILRSNLGQEKDLPQEKGDGFYCHSAAYELYLRYKYLELQRGLDFCQELLPR